MSVRTAVVKFDHEATLAARADRQLGASGEHRGEVLVEPTNQFVSVLVEEIDSDRPARIRVLWEEADLSIGLKDRAERQRVPGAGTNPVRRAGIRVEVEDGSVFGDQGANDPAQRRAHSRVRDAVGISHAVKLTPSTRRTLLLPQRRSVGIGSGSVDRARAARYGVLVAVLGMSFGAALAALPIPLLIKLAIAAVVIWFSGPAIAQRIKRGSR